MNEEAFQLGLRAKTICDNPFWPEFPKPSKKGNEDERNARAFVDGYIEKLRQEGVQDRLASTPTSPDLARREGPLPV